MRIATLTAFLAIVVAHGMTVEPAVAATVGMKAAMTDLSASESDCRPRRAARRSAARHRAAQRTGGVRVGTGDVTGDGRSDVVVAPRPRPRPAVPRGASQGGVTVGN